MPGRAADKSPDDLAAALEEFFRQDPADVVSVYLFGSRAAGRAHRESDVDVAVLLNWATYPSRRERFEERLRLTGCLAAPAGSEDIDLVILNDVPPPLARRIVTSGRRVFSAEPTIDRAFRRTAMQRAADLEPFLRRTRRVKLAALAR